MPLQFHCPNCNALLRTSAENSGTIVNCGRCHMELLVPEPFPPETSPPVVEVDVQITTHPLVDRFTIIDDEPQQASVLPAVAETAEQLEPWNVHRPWYRDPIVVFGWLLPLYLLSGFVVWAAMDLKTRWVLVPARNDAVKEQLVEAPVHLEAKTKEKSEPQAVEEPHPPAAVSPEKPGLPVAAASAEGNDKGAEVADVDEPAEETAFDLRGAVPRVGFKVRERITVTGVSTSEFHKPKAKSITIKTGITKELENIYTVTAVADDQVVEYSAEVVADHLTSSFVGLDFKRRTTEKLGELIEQTIRASKQGQIWVHELRGHDPDEKERIALRQLAPWFADRDSFPSEKQQPGSSWAVDKAHLRKLLGGGVGAVSGSVEAKFVRLEETDDEKLAVINYKGKIRARYDFSDPPDIIGAIDVDLTSLRSPATGIDTKTSGSLTIRASHKTDINGPAQVSEVISLTIDSRANVESLEPKRKEPAVPNAQAVGALPNGPE